MSVQITISMRLDPRTPDTEEILIDLIQSVFTFIKTHTSNQYFVIKVIEN